MTVSPKIKLLFSFFFVFLFSLLISFTFINRTYAAGSTTLTLIPQPGPGDSIQKQVNDTVPIDVWVEPGTDEITILRLQVTYDPTKLEANANNPFTPANDFSITSGPAIKDGKVSVIIDIENPVNNIVLEKTKAGTFNFKAIDGTGDTPTVVAYTEKTEAYSAGSNDHLKENVIKDKKSANITIGGDGGPQGPGTKLSFTVLLHGIGIAGDTRNPTGHSLSNKNPNNPQRQLKAEVYNANGDLVSEGTGTIKYQTNNEEDELNGTFMGSVFLSQLIDDGEYTVKIKTDKYLKKAFPGTINLNKTGDNQLQQISLVAGDITGDNTINLLDFHILRDCGYGALNPLPMTNSSSQYKSTACNGHQQKSNADLNDNGIIDAYDYNLFIREYYIQTGD